MYLYRVHKPGHTYTTTTRHEDKSAQNHLLCNHCRNGSRTPESSFTDATVSIDATAGKTTSSILLRFRPQPFWHLNGHLTTEGIRKQVQDASAKTVSAECHSALRPKELDEWRNDTRHNARIHDRRLFRAVRDDPRMFGGAGNRSDPVRRHQFSERRPGTASAMSFAPDQKQLSMRERDFTGPATVTETIPVHGQFWE